MRFILAILTALTAGSALAENRQTTVFAGGCFWCVESDFDQVEGVVATVSGYSGGESEDPSYRTVSAGGSGHYEVVQITYDADLVSYERLVHLFFRSVDPTDAGGQFCDRGESYRTALFVSTEAEKEIAETARARAEAYLGQRITTPVLPVAAFWPAEDYHQDYYLKNPLRYKFYRSRCGRDRRVNALWGVQAWAHPD